MPIPRRVCLFFSVYRKHHQERGIGGVLVILTAV
jgi:hypothetical protein